MRMHKQRLGRFLALATLIALGGNAQAQEVVKGEQINYLTGDPATWPAELEATVAAPDNHKVLLENDHVRSIELSPLQQEVWQGEVDYWDRVNSRDLEGYLDLWHPDFTGWPCGASGPADLSGLAEFAKGWFAGMTARGQRTVPSAEAVIVKEHFAITYLSAETEWGEEDDRTATKREKFVHTWMATPDGWKIVGGMCAPLETYDASNSSAITRPRGGTRWSLFPSNRTLTHAEDGVVLPDGRLLVGDWDHGLVTLDPDGTKRPFGDFASAGFRTKPDPLWNSPNGISWEPDGRHVLVADITGGHIYRVDTQTEAVTRIYDHPFGVNAAVRDPSGAIWFTQSTQNAAGEASEARMFAAADKPLGDGSVWRIAADEVGKADPQAVRVVEGLDFANGIVFDAPRGRLYVNEIVASRILSFAVGPETGALSDRRVLATLPTPDNIELDGNGDLWVTSPFANAVYKVDPDTGDCQTRFAPTPETSARIVSETYRRLEAGEGLLSLLGPDIWGPMPGLLTGVILAPDGTVYVSGLGNALVRLETGETGLSDTSTGGAQNAIRGAIADWVDIYNRDDWALLAEQFTEDAVMMPPNSPAVIGRSAIAAWEAANEDGFWIALIPDEISKRGGTAIIRGRPCVVIPLADGTTGADVGKFLEVRRRQPDGRWLVSHDIFNSDLPAGGDLADGCPDESVKGVTPREDAADVSN